MRSIKVAKSMGYSTIFWSLAYYDYDTANQPGKNFVIRKFKTYYHNGMIPLIHACSKSNTEALGAVLTFLKKKGFRFGTLDEFAKTVDVWEFYGIILGSAKKYPISCIEAQSTTGGR